MKVLTAVLNDDGLLSGTHSWRYALMKGARTARKTVVSRTLGKKMVAVTRDLPHTEKPPAAMLLHQ